MWYTEDTKEKVVGSIGGRQEWNNFMEKEMNREMSCRLNNGGWEEKDFFQQRRNVNWVREE